MDSIVQALVAKRKEFGLTQQDLAKRLGISQAAIASFESEKKVPRLDTLQRLANELGLEITFALVEK